jgi:hypothetical protein
MDRDKQNAAWRRWYRDNAKRKLAWQQRRKAEIRVWWSEVKATKSCARCGESDPDCLQFHHIDPTTKEFTVSNAVAHAWSRERILAEVAKCEVLCANCHLKHHWEARQRK